MKADIVKKLIEKGYRVKCRATSSDMQETTGAKPQTQSFCFQSSTRPKRLIVLQGKLLTEFPEAFMVRDLITSEARAWLLLSGQCAILMTGNVEKELVSQAEEEDMEALLGTYVIGVGEAEAFSERLKREFQALEAAN
ncbi:hypothetical protein S83_063103, partial [Arachis hypogaea]